MHIGTLVEILHFIEITIKKNNLIGKYESLLALYQGKKKDETYVQKITEQRKEIVNTLLKINPKKWTDAQNKIFIKFNSQNLLGDAAIARLNEIFEKTKGISEEIEAIISSFKKFEQEISQLLLGLEPLTRPTGKADGTGIELEERHHLLYIQFEEALFIQNISQLEKFCRIWNRILASFAYLTQEPIEEIRIHDIESCSITFFAGIKTINAITRGTLHILKGYKKVLEVRRLQLELDELSLSNKDEIKNLLEEEVVNIVDVISASVTEELLKKYEWTTSKEQDDVFKSVQISLKQTINFIEKGGKIDSNHAGELREMNSKIISMLKSINEMELAQI